MAYSTARNVTADLMESNSGITPCFVINIQWRRQLWDTGARAPPPSTSSSFILVHFGVKLTANYLSIVLSARSPGADVNNSQLSISTALVTKLLVIEQLLQPALKFAVSAP